MSIALTVSPQTPGLPIPAADAERAQGYANADKAAATRRAYGTDFSIFRAWCEERQLDAIPASPATVAAFLAHEASRNIKASTIGRRVAKVQQNLLMMLQRRLSRVGRIGSHQFLRSVHNPR